MTGLAVDEGRTRVRLYGDRDLPWIAEIVDVIVAAVGQPWRVLRERASSLPHRAVRVDSILRAFRRTSPGRRGTTKIARRVRELVLGHPAVDATTRAARLAAAADQLGLPPHELEELLWIDLADEGPVRLAGEGDPRRRARPDARMLAAYANLERVQRLVRRATTMRIRVSGDAHELVRGAQRLGLVCTARRDHDLTMLEILGPLASVHDTSVYGRSLARLVPAVADRDTALLDIDADLEHGRAAFRVATPWLLPAIATSVPADRVAARLARELRRLAPSSSVTLDPPPLVHEDRLLYPDLVIEQSGARWWIELLGFATGALLRQRLADYDATGAPTVLLCVPDRRVHADVDRVLAYEKRIEARDVLAHLGLDPR